MKKPLTGAEQNAQLDELLCLARADAISFARQASALVTLNNLAAREESELSRMKQFPILELAGTLRMGQGALSARVAEAERLVGCLTLTHAACLRGELLVAQAKVLLEVTKNASPTVAHRVEALLLPTSIDWCTADLRRKAKAALLQVESELDVELGTDLVTERLKAARASRKVTLRPDADGMAYLGALLPAEQAVVFRAHLDELARRAKVTDAASGIFRTADQRRADLLAELPGLVLNGRCTGGNGAGAGCSDAAAPGAAGCGLPAGAPFSVVLNVTVPMDTVLDRGVQPGFLDGFGPISAEHVRQLRPTASVRVIYAGGRSGQPLSQSRAMVAPQNDEAAFRSALQDLVHPIEVVDREEPQHDPSAALTRLVRLRDVRCAGPGCSVPARRCDRDHHVPYDHAVTGKGKRSRRSKGKSPGSSSGGPPVSGQGQGPVTPTAGEKRLQRGPTAAWNLVCLSRRCHQAKHNGWTLTRHDDGSVTWLSPLGRTYDKPSPHERPQPTDWARFDGSSRWDATGLRLLWAAAEPVQHRKPSSVGDQDWDWGHSLTLTNLTGDRYASSSNPSSSNPSSRAERDDTAAEPPVSNPPPF